MIKFFTKASGIVAISMLLSVATSAHAGGVKSIKQTVQDTLDYNPTIKSYQEYQQSAQYDVKAARSGFLPSIDARAAYGFARTVDQTTRLNRRAANQHRSDIYYDRSEASLTISQTIWDGMATWNRVSLAQSKLESAEQRLYDNAEALSLDAILAHIEVFRQRRIVALAELNVKNHQRILASQRERQRSGASTLADVTQTQSRLTRTQASLAESRSALEVAIANYQRLTGKLPEEVESPSLPGNAYPSLESALARTHTGNLKILAQRADIKSEEAQEGINKSGFHPQIYLEAGPTYNHQSSSTNYDVAGNAVMLRANWNLFNGGYDWYNVKSQKARTRQSKQSLAALYDSVAEETTATWSQLVSAQEQAKFYSAGVDYATKTRSMYLEQFNVGQRSLLDVLDSENEVFTAAIQLVTAQQNIIAGQYRLLALGGDLLANFSINRSALAINNQPE